MLGSTSLFIAGQEWIFILIIAAVLIFGARKIPELAKTFGKAKGEYEKGKIEADKELAEFKKESDSKDDPAELKKESKGTDDPAELKKESKGTDDPADSKN